MNNQQRQINIWGHTWRLIALLVSNIMLLGFITLFIALDEIFTRAYIDSTYIFFSIKNWPILIPFSIMWLFYNFVLWRIWWHGGS